MGSIRYPDNWIWNGLPKTNYLSYILPERMWFDKNHFSISMAALFAGIYTWLSMKKICSSGSILCRLQFIFIAISIVSGFLMMIKFEAIFPLVRLAYTIFDLSIVLSVIFSIIYFLQEQIHNFKTETN